MNKQSKSNIDKRVIQVAKLYIAYSSTVRAIAKMVGVSKSTIHKDLTDRLSRISPSLYEQVLPILERNKKERAIRGGNATKEKYLLMKEQSSK